MTKSTEMKGLSAAKLGDLMRIKQGTPVLKAIWPALGTPKVGGEYDGEYGKYQLTLLFDPKSAEGKALMDSIKKLEKKATDVINSWAKANNKKVLALREFNIRDQLAGPDEDAKPTGMKMISFSSSAAYLSKKTGRVVQTPVLVKDSTGNALSTELKDEISTGSLVRVAFDATPYYVSDVGGLSLKMKFVQLKKLIRYGEDIETTDYFSDELEDGYVMGEDEPEETSISDDSADF